MDGTCTECHKRLVLGAKRCGHCGYYVSRRDRVWHNILSPFVIGLLTGCIILYAGKFLAEKSEYNKMKLLLQTEFDQNYFALAHNDEWLKKNKGWLGKEKREKGSLEFASVVLIDLKPLKLHAGDTVRANLVFLKKTEEKFRTKITDLYSTLGHIDTMVRNREAYRLSNTNKRGAASHVEILDNNLMAKIKEIEPLVMEVGDYLFSSPEWKLERRKLLW